MATVACDICGGYLPSHKRLAHSKTGPSAAGPVTEKEAIQKIAFLYASLSVNARKRVIRLLTAKGREVQKDQKVQ